MTDADAILVRVLAHADALRLPLRDWSGFGSANRYHGLRAGGVPYRVNSAADEGLRKAGERRLVELADAGFLTVSRGPRVKFPLCALTPTGDATARAVAGLPGRAVGRLFLAAVVEKAAQYIDTISGRWCPEIDLNGGKGWGDATAEDRRGLSDIELDFLAAAAAGWAVAGSTSLGHVAYAATPVGLAELANPSDDPVPGPLPDADPEAARLYRREQDAKLAELHTRKPDDPREIGPLPLSLGLLLTRDEDLDGGRAGTPTRRL